MYLFFQPRIVLLFFILVRPLSIPSHSLLCHARPKRYHIKPYKTMPSRYVRLTGMGTWNIERCERCMLPNMGNERYRDGQVKYDRIGEFLYDRPNHFKNTGSFCVRVGWTIFALCFHLTPRWGRIAGLPYHVLHGQRPKTVNFIRICADDSADPYLPAESEIQIEQADHSHPSNRE